MTGFLIVGVGGAIGSMLRYAAGLLALRLWGAAFPWGTLTVNISGSFLIGILAGLMLSLTTETQEATRLFAIIGVLGGFTTFSAYSLDSLLLLQKGEYLLAAGYILGSVILSILATALGYWFTRALV